MDHTPKVKNKHIDAHLPEWIRGVGSPTAYRRSSNNTNAGCTDNSTRIG